MSNMSLEKARESGEIRMVVPMRQIQSSWKKVAKPDGRETQPICEFTIAVNLYHLLSGYEVLISNDHS